MAQTTREMAKRAGDIEKEVLWEADGRTPEQRMETGRRLREKVPLAAQATWEPPEGRVDPVELLRDQEAGRIKALIPVRHERMSASAFAFYRGTALVMSSHVTPSTSPSNSGNSSYSQALTSIVVPPCRQLSLVPAGCCELLYTEVPELCDAGAKNG